MDSKSTALTTPSTESRILSDSGPEDEQAHLMLNSCSPIQTDTETPSQPPGTDSASPDSADTPAPGRKRRLSFKEKQRQSITHFGSSTTKFAFASDSMSGTIQSPTSTRSSSSPQQLDISLGSSQSLQPARKKTTTDTTGTTLGRGSSALNKAVPIAATTTTGCVFTALEPTRGGPRGAARRPNRSSVTPSATAFARATLSASTSTSTEASPLPHQQFSPPSPQTSASVSFVRSPLAAAAPAPAVSQPPDATVPTTSSSASPLTLTSPDPLPITPSITTAAGNSGEGRDAREADKAGRLLSTAPPSQPSDSPNNVLSSAPVSLPKAFSSSPASSPKLSFKDRQRVAAAAAAAASNKSRNPSTHGSASSPLTQTCAAPAGGMSTSTSPSLSFADKSVVSPEGLGGVATRSATSSLAAAEPSVNREKALMKASALPATAAVVSPTQKSPTYVDPAVGPTLCSGSTDGCVRTAETHTAHIVPKLPMDRIRGEVSPYESCTAAPLQQPKHQESSSHSKVSNTAPPSLPPLTLPVEPSAPAALANPSARAASSTVTSASRSTQSAPATTTERRPSPAHTNPLVLSPLQEAEDTTDSTHPTTANTTVAELHSRSSQTHTSSQAENVGDDDADEESASLAFTQNATRLHFCDPDEPAPQAFTMAVPRTRVSSEEATAHTSSSEIGVRETRSATMVEMSITNNSPDSTEKEEEEEEGRLLEKGQACVGSSGDGGGGGGSDNADRRLHATRRARTDSLGSLPPSAAAAVSSNPSPGVPLTTRSSHSPFKVPTSEQAKQAGHGGCATNTVIERWKQQNKTQQHQYHQQLPISHTNSSVTSQEPSLSWGDGGEHSASLSDAQLSHTSRSRTRRYRDKMLAPDGAVLSTPRTGRGPGGDGAGTTSALANIPTPRMHARSHTVDDFALYNANPGRRGTLTPSAAVNLSCVLSTNNPTPVTLVPPVHGHTVAAANAGGSAGGEHAGPLDASDVPARSPLPLSPSISDTMSTGDLTGGRAAQVGSPRNRGLVGFPALPPLHDHLSSSNSGANAAAALNHVSFAMAAVLTPSGPSAENFSSVTPVTVATPNGYRSADDRSSNEASHGTAASSNNHNASLMDVRSYNPAEERRKTTLPEDLDNNTNNDGDYLTQTCNSYYGGETSLSATTAELRKLRRRSNYSSLHYGTMTGYHRRGDSRRPRSGSATASAARKGRRWQHRFLSAQLDNNDEDEEGIEAEAKLARQSLPDGRSNTVLRQGPHSSDNDDEESICEQKGSEADRDRAEEEEEKANRWALHNYRYPLKRHHTKQQQQQSVQQRGAAAGVAGAVNMQPTLAEEDDDAEDGLRRTVGMWETIEHIFLPQYELAPEAASKEPLTGPASPNSPHPSGTGSTGRPDAKTGVSSPPIVNLKSASSSPKALSSHGLQPAPAVMLSSPPVQPKSPRAAHTTMVPPPPQPSNKSPSPSAENSLSVCPSGAPLGPRSSGLVVLPDAANLSDDPSSSASLTFSQFRKTSGQMAGTKRLEPQKFSFGTVAATYDMEPTEEQKLPEGAADAKVAARLVFDAATGVMLMDPEDEGGRYEQQGHTSPDTQSHSSSARNNEEGEVADEGACQCDASFIAKDFKGLDCSRYDASDLYDHCSRCHRRPASFLCLHCLEAVCPSHVQRHHLLNPTQCTLFLNLLDIMSSFDRIFWCEKCKQFTWKYTEIYDSLVDQIAYTRGTYLKHPARDIHCVGYEVRLKDATASPAAATAASVKARNERSMSDDTASSSKGSPARLRRAVSGSSLTAALQSTAPKIGLATFPTVGGLPFLGSSPQLRSSTPSVTVPSSSIRASGAPFNPHHQQPPPPQPPQPSMLGVNNLIVFGASPSSPMGGNGAVSRLHGNAVGTPSLHPLKSPMQGLLSRDSLEASGARAVTVGEPVTKLCALGARVQGWRTTQEDAEAVFLVNIPALSNEVVDRKELRAVAAAAVKKKKKNSRGQNAEAGVSSDSDAVDNTKVKKEANEEGVAGSTARAADTGTRGSSEAGQERPLLVHETSDLDSSDAAQMTQLSGTLRASDLADVKETKGRRSMNEEGGSEKPRPRTTPLDDGNSSSSVEEEEDEKTAKDTIPMAVFCVFDGHGGDAVAKLAARHFETHLRRAIDGTRPDDVRARALLFYLDAESNAAALLGPQLTAVTAVPSGNGSFTFMHSTSSAAALAATQRGSFGLPPPGLATCSPPPFLTSSPNLMASPKSGPTARSSSSHSKLLVPGESLPRAAHDLEEGSETRSPLLHRQQQQQQQRDSCGGDGVEEEEEDDKDMPQFLQLPDAMHAESIPLVMPVTAESLRLHMAGNASSFPGASGGQEDGSHKAPPPNVGGQDSTGVRQTHGLSRSRKSKTTLDAWADMEVPSPPQLPGEMTTSAAVGSAASIVSPMNARLLPPSFAGACAGGGSPDFRHFSITNPQAAVAASTAGYCAAPSAWVTIPEMEMLRQYFASIMEDALLSLDDYLRTTPEGIRGDYDCVGCTACVVGITANFVLCANVGDSGAAFYTKDRIKVISVKHRVSDAAEQQRINAAGYSIVKDRIEGMSAVPRALGDFDFKQCGGRGPHEQAVTAVPDVTIMPAPSDTDQWGIILACDGVWDTATLHQVHVALTNTMNDLDVASSATDAVLRGAELYTHHLRGPGAPRSDLPSSSPQRSSTSLEGSGGVTNTTKTANSNNRCLSREGSLSSSPVKRRALLKEENDEGSVIGDYECEEGCEGRRLPQVDPILLTAAAGVFAQCVAPADNDEGVGLDNCSLIIVERRNVQE